MHPRVTRPDILKDAFVKICLSVLPCGTTVLKSSSFHDACILVAQFDDHYVALHIELISLRPVVERPTSKFTIC